MIVKCFMIQIQEGLPMTKDDEDVFLKESKKKPVEKDIPDDAIRG